MPRLLCLLLLSCCACDIAAASRSLRVLVVGSEWSDQERWPLMSAIMAAQARPPVGVMLRSLAARGASLDGLVATPLAQRQLGDGRWDLILVQVHPLAAAFEPTGCAAAIERIATTAEAERILLWHPPGPSVEPERRVRLEAELDALATRLGLQRWDLEAAWATAAELGQPIEDELGLPTQQGAYLLAAALFAEFTGKDPLQAATRIDHEALEPLWLPAETAEILQRAADLALVE